MNRADQAVSITDVARSAKKFFDRLTSGDQDRYVVMRNNVPAAVMLSVKEFEAIMDELEDLRIEAIAAERLAKSNTTTPLVSHKDMFKKYE